MGKSAPSAPAAPDPAKTAEAQGAANKETAVATANMNRINQYTPTGSSVYTQIGTNEDGTPRYRQDVTYSPEQQKLYDSQVAAQGQMGTIANQQLGRLGTSLAQPYDVSGAPALASSIDTNSPTYQAAEKAYMGRINPQLDQQQAALEQRLANQGIAIGSDAYNKAMNQFGQTRNDAQSQGVLHAMQLAQSNAALQNQARQQYIQEAATVRNQPLNEISALMSGSQVSNPTFSNVPQVNVGAADITGPTALAYQGQLAQYNAQNAANNAAMGGLFGLGGTILGAGLTPAKGVSGFLLSDRRMKRDIIPLGASFKGFPLYLYRYAGRSKPEIGVMAQDVMQTRPDAVASIGGVLHVNYEAL